MWDVENQINTSDDTITSIDLSNYNSITIDCSSTILVLFSANTTESSLTEDTGGSKSNLEYTRHYKC